MLTSTSPSNSNSTARNANTVSQILAHAERCGLPTPVQITIYSGGLPTLFEFERLADLADWAAWLETTITDFLGQAATYHVAVGDALDHPITIMYTEYRARPVATETPR